MKLVVASRSQDKVREIREILAGVGGVEVTDLAALAVPEGSDEEAIEAFNSFEANAIAKALHFAAITGAPTVADDSGLEVVALAGAPGVRTRRFAPPDPYLPQDEANNRYLLQRLHGLPDAERGARYVCVAAYLSSPRADPVVLRGEVAGRILTEGRGQGGFGYDPLFFVEELGCTFAEVSSEDKNALSHRGRAFRALRDLLMQSAPS